MDQSEGAGKIDYFDAELAKEYLVMPLRFLGLQGDMAEVKEIFSLTSKLFEIHQDNMQGMCLLDQKVSTVQKENV